MDKIIAVALPFVVSIFVQLIPKYASSYARNAAKITLPEYVAEDSDARKIAIQLAVHTYLQMSFFFSLATSTIFCISFTILSSRPIFAALAAVITLALLIYWLIKWQGLGANELEGREGVPMRIATIISILALWVVTTYALVAPGP